MKKNAESAEFCSLHSPRPLARDYFFILFAIYIFVFSVPLW